VRDDNVIK
jgi:hypothetical protein